jgi:hypothetical protein
MMGHHSRGEALFYYFRLEDQVPEDHLLRIIDKHVSTGEGNYTWVSRCFSTNRQCFLLRCGIGHCRTCSRSL